ncbi:MAG: helix-turn-helix transcriptional regulator [Tannerellaceae bacterium]|jgi:DNA-binding CsgD family transcriptional regulator|nr:helix-turn-helix transcriptional regulator [Tannerellaceae bacterium]
MMQAEDFYLSSHTREIPEEEYRKAEIVVDTLNAVSRITFQNLYVIDYYKKKFLYVSENPLFLCGHTAEEVRELGYGFYREHTFENNHAMLTEIYRAGFDFYEHLPAAEKLQHTMSYDFLLKDGHEKILVNHKFTPILLTDDGKVWLAACAVTPSSHTASRHLIMYRTGSSAYREYSFDSHSWGEEKQRIALNEKERKIMLLAAQGYTMDEIAEKLGITPHTVKYHKKELFKKLDTENMMEALLFAENYKLL